MSGILISKNKDSLSLMNSLSGLELKLLFTLVQHSKDNIVNMNLNERSVLEMADISYKTFQRVQTKFFTNKILVKTGISKVIFIDPFFVMNGYSKNIISIAADIQNGKKYWLEDATKKREEREAKINAAHGEESLSAHFERKREFQSDMTDDELGEMIDEELV